MVDPEYKQFLISELSKRGLSTEGTFRVLQQRYQAAIREENDQSENNNLISNVSDVNISEINLGTHPILTNEEICNLFQNESNGMAPLFDEVNEDAVFHSNNNGNTKSTRAFIPNVNLTKPEKPVKKKSKSDNVFDDSDSSADENDSENSSESDSKSNSESDSESDSEGDSDDDDNKDQNDYDYFKENKVYVGNFPYRYPETKLLSKFKKYGNILSLNIPRKGAVSHGYGFIVYENAEQAQNAIKHMDKSKLKKRRLRVQTARKPLIKPIKRKNKKDEDEPKEGTEEQKKKENPKKMKVKQKVTKEKKGSGKKKQTTKQDEMTKEKDGTTKKKAEMKKRDEKKKKKKTETKKKTTKKKKKGTVIFFSLHF